MIHWCFLSCEWFRAIFREYSITLWFWPISVVKLNSLESSQWLIVRTKSAVMSFCNCIVFDQHKSQLRSFNIFNSLFLINLQPSCKCHKASSHHLHFSGEPGNSSKKHPHCQYIKQRMTSHVIPCVKALVCWYYSKLAQGIYNLTLWW